MYVLRMILLCAVTLLVLLVEVANTAKRGDRRTSKHTSKHTDIDDDVDRTCRHANKHLGTPPVNSRHESENCSKLDCFRRQEMIRNLENISNHLLLPEESPTNISSMEWESNIFIPAFQLFNCAVKSLHRFHKFSRNMTSLNLASQIVKLNESKQFLSRLCRQHMDNNCCYKSREVIALRGYMKVPDCSEIFFHLAKSLPKTGMREGNKTYVAFLNLYSYEERLRAKLFLDGYRIKALL